MNNLQQIRDSANAVMEWMNSKEYSYHTIKNHSGVLNVFIEFVTKNQITNLGDAALIFIEERTGVKMPGLWGKGDQRINRYLKPIQNLIKYHEIGKIEFSMRSKMPEFTCPKEFKNEYSLFQEEYFIRSYAKATIILNNNIIHKLLFYLKEIKINSSKEISVRIITDFLKKYSSCRPKYIATILYVLRNYLKFLYIKRFIHNDIAASLPSVRIMRNAFIPHSWRKEDVINLLNSIDREDPKGKRDYAIILMVVRLGLRASDIRSLNIANIDWQRKTINLTMKKTGFPLELPLLNDIGWAIIDYLKNGRPKTKCTRLFVRHRAPFDSVGENESFYRELHRYMQAAGITPPQGVHCGLHSLRSTLARQMLDSNAPLTVISETLGHQNINTTSIYLKIDLEGLRKCTLDPEEVLK